METIRVCFVDHWKNHETTNYVFRELFQERYNQVIDEKNPEIVFFSHKGNDHKQYKNCIKVFYSGENLRGDPNTCDFSFGFGSTTDTHFELTNFARQKYYFDYTDQKEYNHQEPTKFCNFICRNKGPQERIRFTQTLMKYKHVDCPGEVLNNVPNFTARGRRSKSWLSDKIGHLGQYKFTVAFENESSPDYVTEKIFDAFVVGSIPIYWGAPNISEFFNPDSFINVQDFDSYRDAIEYVKEIDNNPDLYQKMRAAAPIHSASKLVHCNREEIWKRFDHIVRKAKHVA